MQNLCLQNSEYLLPNHLKRDATDFKSSKLKVYSVQTAFKRA
jgi:hypothetical protein